MKTLAELEALYASAPLLPLPRGRFDGRYLAQLQSPGARAWTARVIDTVAFGWTPFGVDLDTRRWYFFHPRLKAGHFRVVPGPSRWRDTEALQLHYDVSRTPLRALLYDELKPLADGRILGLGGVDRERGLGEHFFFLLTPRAESPMS